VFASNNCLPRQFGGWSGEMNPRGVNPLVMGRRAMKSVQAQAQGVALYQSDAGVQGPELRSIIAAMHDPVILQAAVEHLEAQGLHPITPQNAHFGIDNHSAQVGGGLHAGPGSPAGGA
jgi:hypothetical protein